MSELPRTGANALNCVAMVYCCVAMVYCCVAMVYCCVAMVYCCVAMRRNTRGGPTQAATHAAGYARPRARCAITLHANPFPW